MFCNLNYRVDKLTLRDYFFKHFERAAHHRTAGSEITYWMKLFNVDEVVSPIINDLGIAHLPIIPRFSFQYKNTRLPEHIDIDRIVAINFNLSDVISTIHIQGKPYEYESALIDVGTKVHSVEPIPSERLVLKLAIRSPWADIYAILNQRKIIIEDIDYTSELLETDKQFVKL